MYDRNKWMSLHFYHSGRHKILKEKAIFIEGKFEHKITNKMRKQSTLKSTSRRISTPREKDTENMKRNQERYGG